MMAHIFTPCYILYFYRQCDNSIGDIFDSKITETSEKHFNQMRDHAPESNFENNDKTLTGSELVRKYVTFHFYFPVGRHHPAKGIPLLTLENGLLQYQANCDKV